MTTVPLQAGSQLATAEGFVQDSDYGSDGRTPSFYDSVSSDDGGTTKF